MSLKHENYRKEKGLGIAFLDKNSITSEALKDAIIKLLEDLAYKKTAEEFQADMRQLGGAEASAIALIEYLNKR